MEPLKLAANQIPVKIRYLRWADSRSAVCVVSVYYNKMLDTFSVSYPSALGSEQYKLLRRYVLDHRVEIMLAQAAAMRTNKIVKLTFVQGR